MNILRIPFLDLLIGIGLLLIVIFLLVIALCFTSDRKSPYDKKLEDDEQMKYVSEEYNKRKGSKK